MAGFGFGNVAFVGSLGGGAAPPAVGTAFDPTVYDAAYLSWQGANTSAYWEDLSGKARHLRATNGTAAVFPHTANVRNGKAAYVATAAEQGNFFVLPVLSTVAADYTITVAFGVTTATQFTVLRPGDVALAFERTYLGINTADLQAIYQNAGTGATVGAVAGDTLLLTYQLNAATGATIRRNRVVAQSGIGYLAAKFNGGDAFTARSGNIVGPIYALLLSVGNRTAAQIDAAEAYLTEQLAL